MPTYLPGNFPETSQRPAGRSSLALVLREAKRLHRLARSESLSSSLPVLRRLLTAGVLRGIPLPEAFRTRQRVQRKHLLRLLAVDAGFSSWEAFRPALTHMHPSALTSFAILESGWANLHHWFASEAQAQAQVDALGGRVVRVGRHAVALTAQQLDHHAALNRALD